MSCIGDSLLESSESLYSGGSCGLRGRGFLNGVSTMRCGLNRCKRRAEAGCGGGLGGNMWFPVRECRRRPLGDVKAAMHPG